MTKSRFGVLQIILFLIVCTVGCSRAPTSSLSTSAPGKIIQAAVVSVDAQPIVDEEARVVVKGLLPDDCTNLGSPAVNVVGRMAVVILPAKRDPAAKNCQVQSHTFEQAITLGKGLQPGRYAVSVNGINTVLDIPGPTAGSVSVTTTAAVTATAKEATSPTEIVPTAESTTASATATAASLQADASPTPQPTATPADNAPAPTAQPTPITAPVVPANNPADPSTNPATPQTQACINKAAFFLDVSVPDGTIFNPSALFTKTWRVRNAGTCTWQGYSLVFQQGDSLSAPTPVLLPGRTAPGETLDISLKMTAPQKPGGYISDWWFVTPSGQTFGLGATADGLLWTKIGVRTEIPTTGGSSAPSCPSQGDSSVEAEILSLINAARVAHGLPALTLDDGLSTAARLHSRDMACNNFVEHYGSDGSTWYGRVQAQKIHYKDASENIYAGSPEFGGTAQGAFNWWMNSQIHRDNILNPRSTRIGIGYTYYDASDYKGYYTLDFIIP